MASIKIFRTESNLDGYFPKLFAINFEPKAFLCLKIIFKLVSLNIIKTCLSVGVNGVKVRPVDGTSYSLVKP